MAVLQHSQEMHPHKGLLPPSRELFLEIQVNKLINEYLFSSNAEESSPLLDVSGIGSVEFKKNNVSALSHVASAVMSNACNGEHQTQTITGAPTRGQVPYSHTLRLCDSSFEAKAPKNVCDVRPVNACLSRVDTFPCTIKGGLPTDVTLMTEMEMKVSSKKPPLPPKIDNSHPDKFNPSLKRCFSDKGTIPQSVLRTKLEKKRKITSPSSGNTSLWALLFTLCFAVIMIAQGFWSQSGNDLAAFSTVVPSHAEEFLKVNLQSAQGDASSQGMLLASHKKGVDRVKVGVQAERVSDTAQWSRLGT